MTSTNNNIKHVAIAEAIDKIAKGFTFACGRSVYEMTRSVIEGFENDSRVNGLWYDVQRNGVDYVALIERGGEWSVWTSIEAYENALLTRSYGI